MANWGVEGAKPSREERKKATSPSAGSHVGDSAPAHGSVRLDDPGSVLRLQRMVGNRTVVQMFRDGEHARPPMLQRRFLDRTEDWVTASTKKGTFGNKSRSKELKAVDRALADYLAVPGSATREAKKASAEGLKSAIAAWRLAQKGPSIRDAEIGVLSTEGDDSIRALDLAIAAAAEQRRQEREQARREKRKEAREKKEREEKAERERLAAEAQRQLDLTLKPWAEIEALTLGDLVSYLKVTPNWHARSTLTDAQRATVRKLEPYGAHASCQAFIVRDVAAIGSGSVLDAALTSLDAYIAGVGSNTPFSLEKEPTVAKAVKLGKELAKLTAAFPAWVLKTAMDNAHFRIFVDNALVDDVVKYYTTSVPKPIFQAENGRDFLSYAQMMVNDSKDPLTYQSTVLKGKVRNFHRFEAAALDQLVANYADRSKAKPLTIIVHAAIDHNGAFHRDPLLTAVVTNPNINTLLIEGGETLASYQSEITPLAQAYGMNNKIDQVMFAGHGNSRLMQMAGTVEEGTGGSAGKLAEKNDMIDLDGNPAAANALFDEVLKNMDPKITGPVTGSTPAQQANRRVLFNACLTNSNAVPIGLSEGKSKAKAEIIDYITKNASLATYFQKRAQSSGKDVTSLGANASIGQVELIKPSGQLDMVSTVDPKVTASKLIYAEEGIEPAGVLRAALEAWAGNEKATLSAMQRRAGQGSDKWDDVIIESMYKEILREKKNTRIASIIQIYERAASQLSEMKHDAHCKLRQVLSVRDLPAFLRDPVLLALAATPTWTGNRNIRLVIAQLGLVISPTETAAHNKLLAELDTSGWDAKSAPTFLDIAALDELGCLPAMLTGPATDAKIIVALVGVLDGGALAPCKSFLAGLLQPALPEIPALAKVEPVPPVPESAGARGPIAEVPAVPGRPAAVEVPGQRPAVTLVADLPKLDGLPAFTDKKGRAPGRGGRPGRDAVKLVPAVEPYFLPTVKIKQLVADRKTEAQISTLVR